MTLKQLRNGKEVRVEILQLVQSDVIAKRKFAINRKFGCNGNMHLYWAGAINALTKVEEQITSMLKEAEELSAVTTLQSKGPEIGEVE